MDKLTDHESWPDPSPELRLPPDYIKNDFPSSLSTRYRRLLQTYANDIVLNMIVAQDGSKNLKMITQDIDLALKKIPKRYVIKVKKGTYKDNMEVGKTKTNIMFIREGMEAMVILGSMNVIDNSNTFNSDAFDKSLLHF